MSLWNETSIVDGTEMEKQEKGKETMRILSKWNKSFIQIGFKHNHKTTWDIAIKSRKVQAIAAEWLHIIIDSTEK